MSPALENKSYLFTKNSPIVALICLIIFSFPSPVSAQRELDTRQLEGPLNITADFIQYRRQKGTATARGNVVIEYVDSLLTGNECFIDNNTGIGIMEGDVKLLLKDIKVGTRRMEFNINTGLGVMEETYGVTREGYSFTAEEAIRVEKERYYLKRATITTCDPEDPDWLFKSSSTDFRTESVAVLKNARFFFKGFPIFYAPIWAVPTVTKRKTGFLFPEFGLSNRDGLYFNNSYFIALSDQSDITLYLDILELRGPREGFDYRYAFAKNTYGEVNFDYINDRLSDYELWRFGLEHRHRFRNGIDNMAKIEMESDPSYTKDFSRDVGLNTKWFTDSYLEFSYTMQDKQVSLFGRSYEGLKTTGSETEQSYHRLPELSASLLPHEIFKTPLVGGLYGSASSFALETDETTPRDRLEIERLYLRPTTSLPFTPVSGLNVMPWAEGRTNWYSRSIGEKETFSTEYYMTGVDIEAPRIFRIFKGGETLYKHTVTPKIEYTYLPGYEIDGEDRQKAPLLDNLDQSSPKNLVTLLILNRVLNKSETGSLGKQIVTLDITQSYDINEANRKTGDTEKRPFSNLGIDFDSTPADWLLLNHFISYNHYEKEADSMETEIGLKFEDGAYISYERTYERLPKSIFHSGVLGYRVARGLSGEVSAIFNEEDDEFPATQFIIDYRSCCYGVSFSATGMHKIRTYEGDRTERIWEINYMLLFSFKGFGETGKRVAPVFNRKI